MINLLFLVLVEDDRHEEEDRVTEEPQEAALQNRHITRSPAFLRSSVVGEPGVTCGGVIPTPVMDCTTPSKAHRLTRLKK